MPEGVEAHPRRRLVLPSDIGGEPHGRRRWQ
jgi:hypothetical protein